MVGDEGMFAEGRGSRAYGLSGLGGKVEGAGQLDRAEVALIQIGRSRRICGIALILP